MRYRAAQETGLATPGATSGEEPTGLGAAAAPTPAPGLLASRLTAELGLEVFQDRVQLPDRTGRSPAYFPNTRTSVRSAVPVVVHK